MRNLDTQIDALRQMAKDASTSPFLPASARVSILQLCVVIETLASELVALRASLASHCHLVEAV